MRQSYRFISTVLIFALLSVITYSPVHATEKPKKTEMVTYATGPGAETNSGALGVREVEVVEPDSDRVAAMKTAGRFVVNLLMLPVNIVKAFWED